MADVLLQDLIVEEVTLSNATGILSVVNGGTGIALFTAGNFLYASGITTLAQRTPIQVLSDIGGAPVANPAHTGALTLSGQSLTAAQATSLVDLATTWNTTGNPIGLKLNVTNIASGATAKLCDFQVGGVSKFSIGANGWIQGPSGATMLLAPANAQNMALYTQGGGLVSTYGGLIIESGSIQGRTNAAWIYLASGSQMGFGSTASNSGSNDAAFARNAAGVIEVNNGSIGTFADLKLRNLVMASGTLTGNSSTMGFGATDVVVGSYLAAASNILSVQANTGAASFIIECAVQNVGVMNSTMRFGWGSQAIAVANASALRGTLDTGFARNAAGIVEVNNGTVGTFADLKVRHLYTSGRLGVGTTSLTGISLGITYPIMGAVNSYGAYMLSTVQSDVTNAANGYMTELGTQAATFSLGTLSHFRARQNSFGAGSTVTNQYGFYVDNSLIGATNNYAFKGQLAAGAGRYNIYMDGTAPNYFAGNVGVGATSPQAMFEVKGTGSSASNGLVLSNTDSTFSSKIWLGTPGNFDGWLKFAVGTPANQNDWDVAILPGGMTAKTFLSAPYFGSSITGRGDSAVLRWTNNGGNFNGTLDVGQDYASGASYINLLIGPSTGALNVKNNTGTSFLYVNAAGGNVGIGTTTPTTKLQVGDASAQVTLKLLGAPTDKAPLLSLFNSGSREGFIAQLTSGLHIGNTSGLANYTDATIAAGANLSIDSQGRVGIGTVAPSAKLEVAGTIKSTDTTASTSTTTGSIITGGGLGVAGNSTFGGYIAAAGQFRGTTGTYYFDPVNGLFNISTGYITTIKGSDSVDRIQFGAGATSFYAAAGPVTFNNTTVSSSTTTGSVIIAGGLGVAGNGNFGGTVNTSGVILSGQSLTVAQATSLVDLATTWNTTGTPTALKLNVTNTASNAASLLIDLQVGGASKFSVRKDGYLSVTTIETATINMAGWWTINQGGNGGVNFGSGHRMTWANNTIAANGTVDIALQRNAAGVVEVNNGTLGVFADLRLGNLFGGTSTLSGNVASTSTTTGTLIVTGGVGISGALNATTKSFIIPHPTKPDTLLRHGSLEGPEFGVYTRGKGNSPEIVLPEYWEGLVDFDTITVNVTAIGDGQHLVVESINGRVIKIKNTKWFRKSKAFSYFYTVFAERSDVDKLEVES